MVISGLLSLALSLVPMPSPVQDDERLVAAVTATLPERVHPGDVQVDMRRQRDGWAFGTVVVPAPPREHAHPEGWLWTARDGEAGWQVAREGTAGFETLSRASPVLDTAEREVLGSGGRPRSQSATDYRTGMRLPYAVGQRWRYTGGPHPMSGGAWSSIDLAGGDGRVRAARDGVAYTMCDSGGGWLRVVHDDGFATDYYHLEDAIDVDGTPVDEGDFLGHIGVDVSCGGRATGPHVHFSLRRDGDYVAIDKYAFGKWSIRAGADPYGGSALHGSTRAGVGDTLENHGVLGRTEGVVDTNGGQVLNRRAGPGTDHDIVGTLPDGETVQVECAARGTTHTGRNGYTSDMWNRLAGGGWVSDVFLWTGTGDPVAGWC